MTCGEQKGVRKIYVFYADVFLLQNLFMDYAAVMGSNFLLKRRKGGIRLFLVSLLCSVAGLILVLFVKNPLWYQLLAHFVLNTGMVLGCFGIGSKKQFLENWIVTYFAVVLLGGGMEWLQEQQLLSGYRLIQMLITATVLFCAVTYLVQFRSFGQNLFPGCIKKGERQMKLQAYYDSGNQLRDPYTGKAVSILSFKKAEEFLEAEKDSIRLVPYRSLGEQNGLLKVTDVEILEIIQGRRRTVIKNAAIGVAEEGLLEGKEYDLILHAALLHGEEGQKQRKKKIKAGD